MFTTTWQGSGFIEPNDLSTIMFGPYIRADFVFTQFTDSKLVSFSPLSRWVDLNTFETYTNADKEKNLQVRMNTAIDQKVLLFQ